MKVGVLALQGSIIEHEKMLKLLDVPYISVRTREELNEVTHLIIPGGESTTLQLLLEQKGMWELFKLRANKYLKIMGTCAGAILCSLIDSKFEVDRNGFGAQQHSFKASL